MDTTTRQYIIEELQIMLNRDPNEQEIQNAITDIYIMGIVNSRILQDLINK